MSRRANRRGEERKTLQLIIKVIRSLTYIDIIKQLPSGIFSWDNQKLTCDYCIKLIDIGNEQKKRNENTTDKKFQTFKDPDETHFKSSFSKYNAFCEIIEDKPSPVIKTVTQYLSTYIKKETKVVSPTKPEQVSILSLPPLKELVLIISLLLVLVLIVQPKV